MNSHHAESDIALPDLPFSPYIVSEWAGLPMDDRKAWTAYSADQMREYARAALTAAGAGGEAETLSVESALAMLVDLIVPGLDSGNIIADADVAMRALNAGANPGGAKLTTTYIQEVPDKCDRIIWRGCYFGLPASLGGKVEPVATRPAPDMAALVDDVARLRSVLLNVVNWYANEEGNRAQTPAAICDALDALKAVQAPRSEGVGGDRDPSHEWPGIDGVLLQAFVSGEQGLEFDMIDARRKILAALASPGAAA